LDIFSLIPSFGGFLWTLVAFVVALSIIVAVHEYGHYIVARWSGIDADVFSIGFGPVLMSRVDRRGTKWQVAALPVGGFVKFKGDANAASARDGAAMAGLSETELRRTMHGAPLWARSATVAAGPAFNFMLSILLFAVFFLWQGIAIDEPVVGKVNAMPGFETGLMPGDRILAVGGRDTPDLETFGTVAEALEPVTPVSYRVRRGADVLTIDGPFPLPPVVESVRPTSAAMQAGLLAGDVILSVDGQPVTAFKQLGDAVGNSGGAPLALTVWRDGDVFEVSLQARQLDLPLPEGGFETRWLIGLIGGLAFVPETRTPGLFEAIGLGAQQTWGAITLTVSGLGHMITGAISSCNLSGPITIAETSGAAATLGLASFLWFIALLSTAVGFANLIPIPVLDGGHLVLHAFEAVTGRPPSDRALRVLMAGGFALILSLMVFALSNDVFCP